jgi:hypothetical protein
MDVGSLNQRALLGPKRQRDLKRPLRFIIEQLGETRAKTVGEHEENLKRRGVSRKILPAALAEVPQR